MSGYVRFGGVWLGMARSGWARHGKVRFFLFKEWNKR
jgi:hypothetical protein